MKKFYLIFLLPFFAFDHPMDGDQPKQPTSQTMDFYNNPMESQATMPKGSVAKTFISA